MPAFIDRIDKRYGRLTVTRLTKRVFAVPHKNEWECSCDCGNTCIRTGAQLEYPIPNCGCILAETAKKRGVAKRKGTSVTVNQQYRVHKQNAKKRKLTPLDRHVWESIVFKECHYCGQIDTRSFKNQSSDTDRQENAIPINGVDRVDPSLDYSTENCVPCCAACNRMKTDMSKECFLELVTKIVEQTFNP